MWSIFELGRSAHGLFANLPGVVVLASFVLHFLEDGVDFLIGERPVGRAEHEEKARLLFALGHASPRCKRRKR
jgi:hypothetical protein